MGSTSVSSDQKMKIHFGSLQTSECAYGGNLETFKVSSKLAKQALRKGGNLSCFLFSQMNGDIVTMTTWEERNQKRRRKIVGGPMMMKREWRKEEPLPVGSGGLMMTKNIGGWWWQ